MKNEYNLSAFLESAESMDWQAKGEEREVHLLAGGQEEDAKTLVAALQEQYGDRFTWSARKTGSGVAIVASCSFPCPKPISEKEKAILMSASEKLAKIEPDLEEKMNGWFIDEDGALCIPNEAPDGPEWNCLGIEIRDGEVFTG